MAAKVASLNDLLIEEMKDIYHAEKQLTKALPKMAKAAEDEALKNAFTEHLEETQGQIQRLEQAFQLLGTEAKAKTCKAMEGLVAEGQETIEEGKEMPELASDLGLIAASQKAEHYEISGYGTIRTLAKALGQKEAFELLGQNEAEEKKTDKLLTQIAKSLMKQSGQGGSALHDEDMEEQPA